MIYYIAPLISIFALTPSLCLTVLKYIGYYAEIPLCLPRSIEDRIVSNMQQNSVSQGESL